MLLLTPYCHNSHRHHQVLQINNMDSQAHTPVVMEIDEMMTGVDLEDMDYLITSGSVVDTFSNEDLQTMFDFKVVPDPVKAC